ncbi:MAG: hypothetical protein ACRDRD_10170 [Pseudonocardiaceae bacterium]
MRTLVTDERGYLVGLAGGMLAAADAAHLVADERDAGGRRERLVFLAVLLVGRQMEARSAITRTVQVTSKGSW